MFNIHLAAFQKTLAHEKIPALLVTDPFDFFYITGMPGEGHMALVREREKTVFAAPLFEKQLKESLAGWQVMGTAHLIQSMHQYTAQKKIRIIYIDEDATSVSLARKLKKARHIRYVFKPSLIKKQRICKFPEEIERIRKAAAITRKVFLSLRSVLKHGLTEQEVAQKMAALFYTSNAQPAFETIVACGSNAGEPHHIPGKQKILKNKPIIIDAGARFCGYCADLTKTYYLSNINKLYKYTFQLVLKAKKAAQDLIKPGVHAAAIDAAARNVFKEAGMEKYFIHSTGHGVGVSVHEAPRIASGSTDVLQPGMVITIEPGLYFPGKYGIRVEDTLLVTETGYEILTK